MALATEKTADTFLGVIAGTPLNCDWPLYSEEDVEVIYGNESLKAVYPADFTVAISPPDFDTFTVTPTAALLTKINDLIAADTEGVEVNYVTVRRVVNYLTSVTEESVRRVSFLSREIERIWMALQQGKERADRVLSLADKNIGGPGGITLTEPQANKVLAWDGTASKLVNGPSITDIEDVASVASAAAASAADAADSAADAISARDTILAANYAPLASPVFTGNPTTPAPARSDNDLTIANTAFAKIVRGYVNALDYAAGDGVTDDTAALQSAIDAADVLYFPPTANGYKVSGALNLNKAISLVSDHRKSKIVMAAAMAAELFNISSSYVEINKLYIQGDGSQTNTVLRIRTDLANLERLRFLDIEAKDCYAFIKDENAAFSVTDLRLVDILVRQPRERGILLRDAFAYLVMRDVFVDYVGVVDASSNVPGVAVENNQGADWDTVEVTGGLIAGMGNRWGIGLTNCVAMRLKSVAADTMGGYGMRLSGCTGIRGTDFTASLCDQHSLLIANSFDCMFTGGYIGGANGVGGTATQHGVYATGTSAAIGITGMELRDATGYGLAADCSTINAAAITFKNNTAGNYAFTGANHKLQSSQLNSGAAANNVTGPGSA